MKKPLTLAIIISLVLLAGCFGFLKKKEQKPAASETVQEEIVTSESDTPEQQPELPQPPSFQDGDLYLQALAAHDVNICTKIGNESLKARCEKNAPEEQ